MPAITKTKKLSRATMAGNNTKVTTNDDPMIQASGKTLFAPFQRDKSLGTSLEVVAKVYRALSPTMLQTPTTSTANR
ncbi:hypothetical protein EAG_06653 [Camponotus floridanus]|uniref:Uncharacterized protein n=1 Tax=Camponotus floridanus TaxID=104421 RepID=E2AAS9_CAMFO|nr:hypothetical protein EAG_06653 [Camponotus floridanus]